MTKIALFHRTPPNTACTRQVGFCAFFKPFPGFKFFPLPNLVHARPLAGNAHRWAAKEIRLRIISALTLLLALLAGCSPFSVAATTAVTTTSEPTATLTSTPEPVMSTTPSASATTSITPDPARQVLYSPDGRFVAKRYDPYQQPSLEKPTIQIFDAQNMLIWQIPYQGDMPSGDPRPSLSIFQWSNDSSGLYFYYGFQYDGYHTLWDGFNLQKFDVAMGTIEEIVPGPELMAFAFSPDESQIVYARNQDTPRTLVLRNLATKSETSIDINVTSESFIQVGWISWSPSGDKVLFHVETEYQVRAFHLDLDTMTHKEILKFWLEEYWFNGWTQDEQPSYVDYYGNVSAVDVQMGKVTVVVTGTPTLSTNP